MGTTPNYGWAYPDPTDLVKDLPADFELFADAVDADLDGLLGGTTGQVLAKTSAADHDFGWVTASSALLATGTLTGATVNLTSIPTTYRNLQLVIRNFLPATDTSRIIMRFNGDSGTRYRNLDVSDSTTSTFSETAIRVNENHDNAVTESLSVTDIFDYSNTVTRKMTLTLSMSTDATTTTSFRPYRYMGFYNQLPAITEINLSCNSGNFTSGDYFLYGSN